MYYHVKDERATMANELLLSSTIFLILDYYVHLRRNKRINKPKKNVVVGSFPIG